MLELKVKGMDFFDEGTEEYVEVKDQCLVLEHSLISLYKWEQIWEINFLDNENITNEQFLDYVRCMTVNKVDPLIYQCLTQDDINTIQAYMKRKMTATKFGTAPPSAKVTKFTTAEVIYSDMFSLNIPMECAKWHLSSLLTLIRVCAEAQNPKKKMPMSEVVKQQKELNAVRRNQHKTKR